MIIQLLSLQVQVKDKVTCLLKTYKIGDYVWEDVDKDGIQNTNDNENRLVMYW